MKLLVFGGTFDPPHIGHVAILQNAIEATEPDRVLVIPAGVPPHKTGEFTPPGLRLAMCRSFEALFKDLVVSDMELRRAGPSYTVDTLRTLAGQHPGAELFLCIGSDMLLSFTTWREWRTVLQLATLVVQCREGAHEQAVWAQADTLRAEGASILFAAGEIRPLSSTQVRERVRRGEDVRELVPAGALAVMRAHGLYTGKATGALTCEDARRLAKEVLSPKRYRHVENVVQAADGLARHYGEEPQRAMLAAWLHDIVKEESPEALLQMVGEDAIMAGSMSQRPKAVWHGPCAAVYAKRVLGVQDEELLSALACHTTGREDMTRLDKILFLADAISAERDYPGVDAVRSAAFEDLDRGVVTMLRSSIAHERQKGHTLDPESERALAWFERHRPDLF